jgi:phosphomannomutase
MKEAPCSHIGKYPVTRISHEDGIKLFLENENWALLRFSGTEPLLRLAVQADSKEKAREMMEWLRQFSVAEA